MLHVTRTTAHPSFFSIHGHSFIFYRVRLPEVNTTLLFRLSLSHGHRARGYVTAPMLRRPSTSYSVRVRYPWPATWLWTWGPDMDVAARVSFPGQSARERDLDLA